MNAPSSLRRVPRAVRDGPVFSSGEVALLCHVSPRTVAKWFDAGRLSGYRLPGSLDRRFTRASVTRFLADVGIEAPAWLHDRPRLLAVSASPCAWLAAALPGHDVDVSGSIFDAGRLFAERHHGAVLLDFCLGRTHCLSLARWLRREGGPPLLAALCCDDEPDAAGVAEWFGLVLPQPDPERLARFLGGAS